MSITETEAKRICRQSGAYCELKAPGSKEYAFAIADRSIAGSFHVEDDERVTIEFGLADPVTHTALPTQKRFFDDPSKWTSFWEDLRKKNISETLVAATFDPLRDEEIETEVQRVEHVRVGQGLYRKRLELLWDSACAVTGIRQPELLRASHAKPWAECSSGAERLNPYNGLLLNVALDALFDKYLISFDDVGQILLSPTLNVEELQKIGVNPSMKLRFIRDEHRAFLAWHRKHLKMSDC